MKLRNCLFLIPIIIASSVQFGSCQKSPVKFGKIEIQELQKMIYEIDSSANAVILSDYGFSQFIYADTKVSSKTESHSKGFQLKFIRHIRIKILNNKAYHWADFSIPLYRRGISNEAIVFLKAVTYNLEDGKIIKDKLSKNDAIYEDVDEHWQKAIFTLPNVKEGSIIEVRYIIVSDFLFNLPDWQFQYSIPVIRSEYQVFIPEYFHYNQTQKGYIPIKTESDTRNNQITITYTQEAEGAGVKESTYTSDYDYIDRTFSYLAENVEAFPAEKYLTTSENYLSRIEFELASTQYPNSKRKNYTDTWESINELLLKDEDFGKRISRTVFIKDETEAFSQLYPDPVQRMEAIFSFVKSKMMWNGKYSKYTSEPLRRIYEAGTGNIADINLLLTCMLKESGIESSPVILSTRENGIIFPSHASITQINYVISSANIDGQLYLMDASDPHSTINLLPPKCLNGRGRIVNESTGLWVDLSNNQPYSVSKKYNLDLDKEGKFIGTYTNVYSEYAAYRIRNKFKSFTGESEYIESLEEDVVNLDLSDYSIANIDSLDQPVRESYKCELTNCSEMAGDLILFTPLFYEKTTDNPFKLKERKYPVEFNYPITEKIVLTITIPEGYTVEAYPEPLGIALPEKAAKFIYNISILNNTIICSSTFQINKTIFLPEEYSDLKEFYNLVVAKQAEQIIIKKI